MFISVKSILAARKRLGFEVVSSYIVHQVQHSFSSHFNDVHYAPLLNLETGSLNMTALFKAKQGLISLSSSFFKNLARPFRSKQCKVNKSESFIQSGLLSELEEAGLKFIKSCCPSVLSFER